MANLRRVLPGIALALLLLSAAAAAQDDTGAPGATEVTLPPVEVVGASPLGGYIDRDKVPGTVQTLTAPDYTRTESPLVTNTLFQRIPGVTLSDPNGNNAAQALSYRGFNASPLQGTPQGVAVYMSGIRFNEAFGDTVNWDLIPTNAIDHSDLWTNNPVFGLNALGGALNLTMKNGFTYHGFEGEVQGGSYGYFTGDAQYGAQFDNTSVYLSAQGLRDGGWRFQSPADVTRLYGDFGWRSDGAELHLIAAGALSSFGVAAATPIQLLDENFRSVFTTPQTTENKMGLIALNGTYALTDTWSLQGNLYIRGFAQNHVDGNAASLERCASGSSPQFLNHLCLQDDPFPRPNPLTAAWHDMFAILDTNGNPIPCPPGSGNTCDATPYGTVDRTANHATTLGASAQAVSNGNLFGHSNNFLVGGSIDRSVGNFNADSTLGFINPDLTVTDNPLIPGSGDVIHTLGGIGYAPVSTDTRSIYYGLYALDTFDIDERLSATAGARLNIASIGISDTIGTSPDLNSNTTYTHLNPVTGFAYKVTPSLTGYFGYSQSNRAPTPLELSCSNPANPCLLESFLVSDPPLKQVVAMTYEAGLRQSLPLYGGKFDWKAALFRTNSTDDIINVASVIAGRGFFQNVPGTRRQGIEASIQYQSPQWLLYAGYSLLDATYEFTGDLPSPNNPFADANGNVHVVPGSRIPGLPLNQGKLGAFYSPTPQWTLGADMVVVGSSYFVGDDANQNPKLPGYWFVNLHASYQLTKEVQIFGLINNAFNQRYALFGTFFDPSDLANVGLPVTLTDHRTEVLGAPISVYAGIRVTF
ncbi:MAG: TonB-dependent receptor [Acetobacteraceae bacterium]|nr:TonB-dependent receptor [Acetobacteraceae bacterium]